MLHCAVLLFIVYKLYNHSHISHSSWSYGVTLWEMYTFGRGPLSHLEPRDVLPFLKENNRMEKPDECPDEM
jgi:hypothetical protein